MPYSKLYVDYMLTRIIYLKIIEHSFLMVQLSCTQEIPYFLEKTPRLLFISLRELVRRLIDGSYYLRAAFIFSARNVGIYFFQLNAALMIVPH